MLRKDGNRVIFWTNPVFGMPASFRASRGARFKTDSAMKPARTGTSIKLILEGAGPTQGLGTVKRKVEPRPGVLSTQTSPPIS